MNRNFLRMSVVAVMAGVLTLVVAPRDAEAVSLNLINNWKMADMVGFGNGLGGGSDAGGGTNAQGPAWSKGTFPTPGINIHFGVGFGKGDQVVPYLGLGMQRRSFSYDWDPNSDDGDAEPDDDIGAALQFGLEIGAKFFLIERAKGKAPPFVDLAFYKYFGSITADNDYDGLPGNAGDGEADNDDAGDYIFWDQQLLSPTGFRLAFGAEYYFNDNFSLGGQFLGIDFAFARSSVPTNMDLIDMRTQFNLYTMLTMTYRFSFSVRASVQFESEYDYED